MTTRHLTVAVTVLALAMSFGSTAFACYEGCDDDPPPPPPPPEETTKGNNGWGNGTDGTNPGSFAGPASQVETKTNQRVWDKFQGKFEGR